jgi:hypothetical protein
MAEMNQFMFIYSLACVRHVDQPSGVSSHHPVFVIVTGSSSIFFPKKKKSLEEWNELLQCWWRWIVAISWGVHERLFSFTTCRVMTGRTVSCHSCVMHFLSFHSVLFLFIRETQANSSRCVCFVLSCCIFFSFYSKGAGIVDRIF